MAAFGFIAECIFCVFMLQGDAVPPKPTVALPPNYIQLADGSIWAPNGTYMASAAQAYAHAAGDPDWNKVGCEKLYSQYLMENSYAFDKIDGLSVERILELSDHNPNASKIMLGKYDNGGPTSYINKAGTEYEFFSLGNHWDEIKSQYGYTDEDMFNKFNIPFLDKGIKARKTFQFSHNPDGDKGALGE